MATLVADTASTATAYTDATATQAGETYAYQVKAVRGEDRSQASSQAQVQVPHDPVDLAPTGLTAALAEGGGVTLSWTAPAEDADSVAGYEVLRAVGEGDLATLVADTASTATSYTDATATVAGETYAYQVKAIRGEDRSQASDQAQVQVPHDPADLRPTGLTVSLVENKVTLSWAAPTEDADSVTGYEILRRRPSESEGALMTLVADTESTATTYTDATANEAGVVYVYRVKALRGSEVSRWSNFARIELSADYVPDPTPTPEPESTPDDQAPTNLTAALAEGGGVALSWTAPAEDAGSVTGYEVLRAVGEGEFTTLASDTGSTTTAYTDATATEAGETYAYQVKAIRGEDRSQASGQAQVQIPHDPVDLAPSNLTALILTRVVVGEEDSTTKVVLIWTAPAEDADSVTGYEVLRAVGQGELATLAADTGSTTNTYTDATAIEAGETYAYQVKAIRGEDRSQASGRAQVQLPHDPVDLAPSDLTAEKVDGGINLSWTAPAEDADSVTGYEVLRAVGEGELTSLAADTASTDTTYSDTTATDSEETYAYQVKAVRGQAKSQGSNKVIEAPEPPATPENLAPSNLTFVIQEDGVELTWDAPVADADSVTGYRVLRRLPNQGENEWVVWKWNTGSTETAYKDGYAQTLGEYYMYRVRALRGDDYSKMSNRVDVRRPQAAPETTAWAPSNLEALVYAEVTLGEEGVTTQVKLTWDAPAEGVEWVRGYEVQRATCDGGFTTLVADTGSTGTAYTDASVTPGETYTYRVRARRPQGLSLWSGTWAILLPGGDGEGACGIPAGAGTVVTPNHVFLASTHDQDTILVKNTGQTLIATGVPLDSTYPKSAQAFTTGARGVFTLSSIGFDFVLIDDTTTAGSHLAVTLNADNAGDPGAIICAFSDPTSFTASGVQTFDASVTCPTLAASTTYFVVINRVTVTSDVISLRSVGSRNEDDGSVAGWTIGDGRHRFDSTVWSATIGLTWGIEVSGAVLSPPPAVLVKNTGQTTDGSKVNLRTSSGRHRAAQAFTVDANSFGSLSSLGISFDTVVQPGTAARQLTVTLNAESANFDGYPGDALCTLSNPESITANAVNTFDAPAGCPTLGGGLTYFVVVNRYSDDLTEISLKRTTSTGEDTGATEGWSITDESKYLDTGVWEETSSESYQIELRGYHGTTLAPAVTVKNTGQTADGSAVNLRGGGPDKLAQEFVTGTNVLGYRLSSISFYFNEIEFAINDLDTNVRKSDGEVRVTLNAGGSTPGIPGGALCTLSHSGGQIFNSSGVHTFDAGTCPTLEPSATYFAVITRVSGGAYIMSLAVTTSADEDSGGAAGAAIRDRRAWTRTDGSWAKTDSQSHLIEVRAAAVDSTTEPIPDLFTPAGENDRPYGLWSDGTTMWVGQRPTFGSSTPGSPAKIFAYDLATKARKVTEDFNTLVAAGNDYPAGIWSDGTTMFVVDEIDRRMYAYDMVTKERDTDKEEVYRNKVGGRLGGLWSDGTIMWITDPAGGPFAGGVRAFDLASGERNPSRDFTYLFSNNNNAPFGIWADETDMFVSDSNDNIVYAYWKDTGSPNWRRNIMLDPTQFAVTNDDTFRSRGPRGIWSDGTTMWVISVGSGTIHEYTLPPEVDRPTIHQRQTVTVGPVTDTMALVEVDIARLVRLFGSAEPVISVHVVDTPSSASMYVHPEGGTARFLLMGLRPETQYTVVVTYGVLTKYSLGTAGRKIFRTMHPQLDDIETLGLVHTEATVKVSLAAADISKKGVFKFYPHSNRDEAGADYTFYLRHKASDETEWAAPVELTFSDFTADARLTGLDPGTAYDVEVAETEDFMPPTASVASYSGTLTVGDDGTGTFLGWT